MGAEGIAPFPSTLHLRDESLDVPRVFMCGKDARRKIAVSTLGAAEGHGDVEAEQVAAGYCHI